MTDIQTQNAINNRNSEMMQGKQTAILGLALLGIGFIVTKHNWLFWLVGAGVAIAGYNRYSRGSNIQTVFA